MESFKWDDNFLTGLQEVDDQHHKLVDMINRFGELLAEDGLNQADIWDILAKMADYADYHFKEEECLMADLAIDSRHLKYHKEEHRIFLQQVTAMVAEFSSVEQAPPDQLLNFLICWLAYHILGVDQNMARQLQAIQSGTLPQQAYQDEEKTRTQYTEPLLHALTGLFKQLTARSQALTELNKTLEEKVVQRTQELQEANIQLERIAMTDVLTDLPNRRYAMQLLKQLWEDSARAADDLCCMLIDADGFKQINDNYGHDSGDEVLRVLSRELKNNVRNDDVVCRLGGDEFLIICNNTPLDGAIYLAQQIQQKIAQLKVPAGGGCWQGSLSIGVAVKEDNMNKPDALLKAADDGVYLAKAAGRDCVRSTQSHVC
jgi:diguanylate cyclase (GGDEF)-like protein/hemerythrin-like metal-binding protein